jgi:hypothetical protein
MHLNLVTIAISLIDAGEAKTPARHLAIAWRGAPTLSRDTAPDTQPAM